MLDEIKKCALWALLVGGGTSVVGLLFSTDLAYSGWLGIVVAVILIWPIRLMLALHTPYFDGWLWIIPQIGIYFVLILMLRWILRKSRNHQDESTR